MTTSYSRGHTIYFEGGNWFFLDTKEPLNDDRPCKRCGEYPTEDGFDPCLGRIDGAISACCGHGVEPPYIKFQVSIAG